jgi:K+-transporting ATPase A subunit
VLAFGVVVVLSGLTLLPALFLGPLLDVRQ